MIVVLFLLSVLLSSCTGDASKPGQEITTESGAPLSQKTEPPPASSPGTAPPTSVSSQTTQTVTSTSSQGTAPTSDPSSTTVSSGTVSSQNTSVTSSSTSQTPPLTLTLAWDPVNDGTVRGYKVHLGTSSKQYDTHQDVGNVTSYVSQVYGGYTWYFAVSAYNLGGDGPLSQEISTKSP